MQRRNPEGRLPSYLISQHHGNCLISSCRDFILVRRLYTGTSSLPDAFSRSNRALRLAFVFLPTCLQCIDRIEPSLVGIEVATIERIEHFLVLLGDREVHGSVGAVEAIVLVSEIVRMLR